MDSRKISLFWERCNLRQFGETPFVILEVLTLQVKYVEQPEPEK
jgi:hypothetical protein